MLTHAEVTRLLDLLCTQLGFCLAPAEREHLAEKPSSDPRVFTDAVITAEGLDPSVADRHLYRQVRDLVGEAFRKADQHG